MDNRQRRKSASRESCKFRILAIYEYLNEGKKITAKEIQRRLLKQYGFDVNIKTVIADIYEISRFTPIATTVGRNGGHQKVDVLREANNENESCT